MGVYLSFKDSGQTVHNIPAYTDADLVGKYGGDLRIYFWFNNKRYNICMYQTYNYTESSYNYNNQTWWNASGGITKFDELMTGQYQFPLYIRVPFNANVHNTTDSLPIYKAGIAYSIVTRAITYEFSGGLLGQTKTMQIPPLYSKTWTSQVKLTYRLIGPGGPGSAGAGGGQGGSQAELNTYDDISMITNDFHLDVDGGPGGGGASAGAGLPGDDTGFVVITSLPGIPFFKPYDTIILTAGKQNNTTPPFPVNTLTPTKNVKTEVNTGVDPKASFVGTQGTQGPDGNTQTILGSTNSSILFQPIGFSKSGPYEAKAGLASNRMQNIGGIGNDGEEKEVGRYQNAWDTQVMHRKASQDIGGVECVDAGFYESSTFVPYHSAVIGGRGGTGGGHQHGFADGLFGMIINDYYTYMPIALGEPQKYTADPIHSLFGYGGAGGDGGQGGYWYNGVYTPPTTGGYGGAGGQSYAYLKIEWEAFSGVPTPSS